MRRLEIIAREAENADLTGPVTQARLAVDGPGIRTATAYGGRRRERERGRLCVQSGRVGMTAVFYWIDHTSTYEGNSGVQRVTRGLAAGLFSRGSDFTCVVWDNATGALAPAAKARLDAFARFDGPALSADGVGGPLHTHPAHGGVLKDAWLLVPEVTHKTAENPRITPDLIGYARAHGMRVAVIFYDLIPLLMPGYENIASEHARYLQDLLAADVILPISFYASESLREHYLRTLGLSAHELPQIRAILLAEEVLGRPRPERAPGLADSKITIVSLGTLEPRKNQVGLLRAFERLCARRPDLDLELVLSGNVHHAVQAQISALSAANPRVKLASYLSDGEVSALYARTRFVAFSSIEEGYGLPIVEALWSRVPVLCADFGAMRELAEGGGCWTIDTRSDLAIEAALERLAIDDELIGRLQREAAAREFKTWETYAREVVAALDDFVPFRRLLVSGAGRGDALETRLLEALESLGVEIVRVERDAGIDRCRPTADALASKRTAGDWLLSFDGRVGEGAAHLAKVRASGLRTCALVRRCTREERLPGGASPIAALSFGWDLVIGTSEAAADAARESAVSAASPSGGGANVLMIPWPALATTPRDRTRRTRDSGAPIRVCVLGDPPPAGARNSALSAVEVVTATLDESGLADVLAGCDVVAVGASGEVAERAYAEACWAGRACLAPPGSVLEGRVGVVSAEIGSADNLAAAALGFIQSEGEAGAAARALAQAPLMSWRQFARDLLLTMDATPARPLPAGGERG